MAVKACENARYILGTDEGVETKSLRVDVTDISHVILQVLWQRLLQQRAP
jgi:hypothetical protein